MRTSVSTYGYGSRLAEIREIWDNRIGEAVAVPVYLYCVPGYTVGKGTLRKNFSPSPLLFIVDGVVKVYQGAGPSATSVNIAISPWIDGKPMQLQHSKHHEDICRGCPP